MSATKKFASLNRGGTDKHRSASQQDVRNTIHDVFIGFEWFSSLHICSYGVFVGFHDLKII